MLAITTIISVFDNVIVNIMTGKFSVQYDG